MSDLLWYQYIFIGLTFIWSGFVRSGLGFGGAVLALPFLLLVIDQPLIFLPIIAVQLIIFSSWIMLTNYRTRLRQSVSVAGIDWTYLRHIMLIMIVPKLVGVIGLITLPGKIMSILIFAIVLAYAVSYIINRPIPQQNKKIEYGMLALGGYVSGTSLSGAPLIVPVVAANVRREALRDTLFVLWFTLTVIKLLSFIVAGVDLQLIHHLWLLPCALIGHNIGQRFHQRLIVAESSTFFRLMGMALLVVSLLGLFKTML